MALPSTPLYVGTNRFVAALDPHTGAELWRTKLPKCSSDLATILIKGDRLYVGCYGRAFCLDRRDGSVLWQNGLPGLGYCTVLLAMEGAEAGTSNDAAAGADRRRRQQAAAAAGAAGATAAT